ncbi:hypothetical protein D3C76_1100440 [compost metagenome]
MSKRLEAGQAMVGKTTASRLFFFIIISISLRVWGISFLTISLYSLEYRVSALANAVFKPSKRAGLTGVAEFNTSGDSLISITSRSVLGPPAGSERKYFSNCILNSASPTGPRTGVQRYLVCLENVTGTTSVPMLFILAIA